MSHPIPVPLYQLLRLLLTYLVSTREACWPTRTLLDSSHAHGMLSAALVLGTIDREQHDRLTHLVHSASSHRNRELSLQLLPYGRRFPVRRAAA